MDPQEIFRVEETQAQKPKRTILFIMVCILFVLGISIAVWWFLSRTPSSVDTPVLPSENVTQSQMIGDVRVEVLLEDPFPNDQDRDGLSAEEEQTYGTSDLEPDTDGDGIDDMLEITVWKSNPTISDTDGDGYLDGFEISNGYNPNGEGVVSSS